MTKIKKGDLVRARRYVDVHDGLYRNRVEVEYKDIGLVVMARAHRSKVFWQRQNKTCWFWNENLDVLND